VSPTDYADARLVDRATHRHDEDELTWVVSGSCTLVIGERRWNVDTSRALVVPAGVEHVVVPRPDSLVFPLFFAEGIAADAEVQVIPRTAALEACVRVLLQSGIATARAVTAARSEVIRRVGESVRGGPPLVLPTDSRARRVAVRIVEQPASALRLEDWARVVHTSAKTLQRAFVNETGMTYPRWRVRARLLAARTMLEDGTSIESVARAVGYAGAGAFIAAFRREYGITPGAHQARTRAERH
jgi:AraC-like DNA-binding protein